MNPSSVQRIFCLTAVVCIGACSFDPAVQPPGLSGAERDADDSVVEDMAGGGADADAPRDASGGADSTAIDAATPDVSSPASDMSPSEDTTVTDASPVDMTPPPPDMTADTTPPGPGTCDGMMVNHNNDPEHCGECDNACDPVHGSCRGGTCRCPMGSEPCGDANTCTDTAFDPTNCGMCGRACAVGEVCIEGSCLCRPELMRCNGACVDVESDPSHCGDCNVDCGGDVCLDGSCRDRNNCPLGTWPCDTTGGTACIRGQTSDLYCDPDIGDACGTECLGDEICVDPGLFSGPECVTYRPGIGCTDCPCDDCADNEACITTDDIPDVAYCISR